MDSEAKREETGVRYITPLVALDSEANCTGTGVRCITQLFVLDSEAKCNEIGVLSNASSLHLALLSHPHCLFRHRPNRKSEFERVQIPFKIALQI